MKKTLPIVNPMTSQLLVAEPYFDVRQHRQQKERVYLEIRAIEFKADESDFLAPPFVFNDKDYGIAYLAHYPFARTQAEQEAEIYAKYSRIKDLAHIPHHAKEALEAHLIPHSSSPDRLCSTFLHDRQTNKCFSVFDLAFGGKEEIGADAINRVQKNKRTSLCAAFWKTTAAENHIRQLLGEKALAETLAVQRAFADRLVAEMKTYHPCKERPFQLYLLGSDDASWAKTFATEKEMTGFAAKIKDLGSSWVLEQMKFTN